jgi:hypothetical protein
MFNSRRRILPLEQLATKRVLLGTNWAFGFDPLPIFPVFERHPLETVGAGGVPFPACHHGMPASQRATEASVTTRRI